MQITREQEVKIVDMDGGLAKIFGGHEAIGIIEPYFNKLSKKSNPLFRCKNRPGLCAHMSSLKVFFVETLTGERISTTEIR